MTKMFLLMITLLLLACGEKEYTVDTVPESILPVTTKLDCYGQEYKCTPYPDNWTRYCNVDASVIKCVGNHFTEARIIEGKDQFFFPTGLKKPKLTWKETGWVLREYEGTTLYIPSKIPIFEF